MPQGKTLAYTFVLQSQAGEEQTRITGVAVFDIQQESGGRYRVQAHDNLRFGSQADWSRPRGTRLIDAMFEVPRSGLEPVIDERMPYLLGRPRDWFFPPVPRNVRSERVESYEVERGGLLATTPSWDKQNRGHFAWEVKVASCSPRLARLVDRRTFSTENRAQEMSGSGEIIFDQANGLMLERKFRGTYSLFGRRTEIDLRVVKLTDQQLAELGD